MTSQSRPRRSEEDLTRDIDEARAGEASAFERIYHRYAPAVASYLRWNGVVDVDSVTNQVMAEVHRSLSRFSGEARDFRSWLFTIAHHRMVDDLRAESRRPTIVDSEILEGEPVGDVEEDALELLSDERLRDLLDGLSTDQREVLLLRVVADLSLEDVAAALGKQPGAIKSLQHRALASLRRQMEREMTDS